MSLTAAKLKALGAKRKEFKRRILAGEVLVCTAADPMPTRQSEDGKTVYHRDARPTTGTIRDTPSGWVCSGSTNNIYRCPHCAIEFPVFAREITYA